MVGFLSWVDSHFNSIQTIGIIGSLWMVILAAHREAKAKEVENLLTIAAQHRELWSEAIQKSDLQRVFKSDADIAGKPTTVAEEEFLNLVFALFQTTWQVAKAGGIITVKELGIDACGFFNLPLPHAVWEKTKQYRNQRFVTFVEKAVKSA